MKVYCEAYFPKGDCGKKGVDWFRKGHPIVGDDYWLCQEHLDRAIREQKEDCARTDEKSNFWLCEKHLAKKREEKKNE